MLKPPIAVLLQMMTIGAFLGSTALYFEVEYEHDDGVVTGIGKDGAGVALVSSARWRRTNCRPLLKFHDAHS
jgi:hypothetical protein